MSKMGRFVSLLLITMVLSCGPKDKDEHTHIDNSSEIEKLQSEIIALKEQITEVEASVPTIQNSNSEQKIDMSKYATKEELNELTSLLTQKIEEINIKINQENDKLSLKLTEYIDRLQSQNQSNYVKLTDFNLLIQNLEENYTLKSDMLQVQITSTKNLDEIQEISSKIDEHIKLYRREKNNYKQYYNQAIKAWEDKLKTLLIENNKSLSSEIKSFVTEEIARLKVTQESLIKRIENTSAKQIQFEKDLGELKNRQGNEVVTTYKEIVSDRYDLEISELKLLLQDTQIQVDAIRDRLSNEIDRKAKQDPSKLVNDILKKLYAPCYNGLKGNNYCFTLGTLIQKLGGKFFDPLKFKRTKADLVRYLQLSGVTLPNILKNSDAFLIPSPGNQAHFDACHGDEGLEGMIPPRELWPRGVFLSLLFQNMEKDIQTQVDLGVYIGLIDTRISGITSWWRSPCYNEKIGGSADSDHVYAASFDPTFYDYDSFIVYRNYILNNVWENDIYEIRYPLESNQLGFSIGFGHGDGAAMNGKMHLGVGTPQMGRGQLRIWEY